MYNIYKMESDMKEALDIGAFGPETSMAETSAVDTGITVDDQDHPRTTSTSYR